MSGPPSRSSNSFYWSFYQALLY
ncbi:hypothetical protein ID866_8984 [Astraeus odoratus]|nr:hypothetical protein ID866_8984 [Astraeus odoratus]